MKAPPELSAESLSDLIASCMLEKPEKPGQIYFS